MDLQQSTHQKAWNLLKRAGFHCLEIAVHPDSRLNLDMLSNKVIEQICGQFKQSGIQICSLACCVKHLADDSDERQENNRYFMKALKLCQKFGSDLLMTNVHTDGTVRPYDYLDLYREVFSQYASVAEGEGIRIVVENCPHHGGYPGKVRNLAYSPEMWGEMFSRVDSKSIGLEFDPSHLVFLGIDYVKALEAYIDRVYAFHAKDTEILQEGFDEYGYLGRQSPRKDGWDSGWWRFRMPGMGVIDWKRIFSTLRSVCFEGPIIIEHEDPVFTGDRYDEGLVQGLSFLRQVSADS